MHDRDIALDKHYDHDADGTRLLVEGTDRMSFRGETLFSTVHLPQERCPGARLPMRVLQPGSEEREDAGAKLVGLVCLLSHAVPIERTQSFEQTLTLLLFYQLCDTHISSPTECHAAQPDSEELRTEFQVACGASEVSISS